MGNCCRHESSTTWAGDDWGTPKSETFTKEMSKTSTTSEENEEKNLLSCTHHQHENDNQKNGKSSSSSSSTEVKIRITKKELEELLGKIDVQGLSVEQIIAQLMNSTSDDDQYHAQQRSWRPALQSIPEVN
ncbi:Protein of unknown function DUF4228 [Macleaya cordata]|uniref:Uncharacterized protein n=1 Tax=Macleaya cordata TaxID=56857 RepID=A0A200QLU8_MACCD|nr:Protein of unknown function DUF4228 [Macleaya cordata]